MRRRCPSRCASSSLSPLLLIWWIYLRLSEWWWWPNSSSSWKFSPYLSECYRSCAALTASIIHPRCPWVGKCTLSLEPSVAVLLSEIQIPLNSRLLMESTPPYPSPGNSALPQIRPSGASIMLQLHLSPWHPRCRCAPSRCRHAGGPSNPPDTQLTFPFYLWAPFRIHFTAGWGPANVTGSCKSVAAYFSTSADGAGFLPSPLPLLNQHSCVLLLASLALTQPVWI